MRLRLFVFILTFAGPVFAADCTSPAYPEGTIEYFSTGGKVFKYCNGTGWQDFGDSLWFQSGSDIYYNNGDIGIGTASPAAFLHAHKSSGDNYLYLTNNAIGAGSRAQLWFALDYDGTANWAGIGMSSSGYLRLTGGGDLASPDMVITDGGTVGIGTATPSTTPWLHVADENNDDAQVYITTSADIGANKESAIWFAIDYNGTPNWAGIGQYSSGGLRLTGGSNLSSPHMIIDDSGKVGIGTTNPQAGLDVMHNITVRQDAANGYNASINFIPDSGANASLSINNSGDLTLYDWSSTNIPFQIMNDANHQVFTLSGNRIGINDSTPDVELDVVGDINYTGQIVDVSDRRMKTNIVPLSGALAKVTALQGVSFTMKDDPKGKTELGLIAQEVEPVFPELVSTGGDGIKGLNYDGFIAPLIEAVKTQQAQIEVLQAEIEALKAERSRPVNPYND